ncbi:MAG TPA: glycosyltransferase family 2 protein [Gemmatimonadales bacterium]|nr:glycosyltransferase family 2 protein [Gemmatimonadales bacterium]
MLTVVVPVRDGERFLPASLSALRATDLPRSTWELIVVDDSSRDRSPEVAAEYADTLVRLNGGPRGPACARNRGAAVARGDVLVFVDADVCVHPDALRRIREIFDGQPDVSAVFGAYDLAPPARGLVSQYRNLLHRYVHQRDAGDAVTFWAGCGAVRAGVFAGCGGFDESKYVQASVEDIDLGYRMTALGHRILLRPEIQATHLKQWTLFSMVVTDVLRRGIPWLRLLLGRNDPPPPTLNLRVSEQICTAAVVIAGLAAGAWLKTSEPWWVGISVAAVITVLAINQQLLAWFARHRGWWFAVGIIPLRLLYYALNAFSVVVALASFGFGQQHPGSRAQKTMASTSGSK